MRGALSLALISCLSVGVVLAQSAVTDGDMIENRVSCCRSRPGRRDGKGNCIGRRYSDLGQGSGQLRTAVPSRVEGKCVDRDRNSPSTGRPDWRRVDYSVGQTDWSNTVVSAYSIRGAAKLPCFTGNTELSPLRRRSNLRLLGGHFRPLRRPALQPALQ
jgi:hypothetical protein